MDDYPWALIFAIDVCKLLSAFLLLIFIALFIIGSVAISGFVMFNWLWGA